MYWRNTIYHNDIHYINILESLMLMEHKLNNANVEYIMV